MRIDPHIAALRGDPAPQRHAQEALEQARDAWRAGPFAKVRRDLIAYGKGRHLDECVHLERMLWDADEAHRLIHALFAPLVEILSAHPLGQVPLRHQQSNGLSMLQLGRTGRATLTLLAYDSLDQNPGSACFSASDCRELVLAGSASLRVTELVEERAGQATLVQEVRQLKPGDAIHCKSFGHARTVERVEGNLVLLRLALADDDAAPTRQYSLADGRLVHSASGTREESQREMAMALLGRMGRSDAAPLLAELAAEGSAHIRWQSLRECLALDPRKGFRALARIAANADDELAAQAGALRAQLIEAYPALAQWEAEPCPA